MQEGALHLFLYRGKQGKFTAMKVLTQYPCVLVAKVGWKQGKASGSEAGSVKESGLLGVCSGVK